MEASRAAKEQAEVIRADRDAHVEAVRTVKDQAERIRADRDAQIEVVRAAKEHSEAIRADRDAQLEAARAQQTQLLEETHAQLEATQREAERCVAARVS